MSTCQIEERDAGRSYPRTCPSCGLGKGGCIKGLDREGLRARIADLEAQNAGLLDQVLELENLRDALEAQLAERVKVKPLEWKEESANGGIKLFAFDCFGNQFCGLYRYTEVSEEHIEQFKATRQALYDQTILSTLEATPPAPKVTATHRHKKRGSEYVLIGIGKMQAKRWYDPSKTISNANVDMREVAIYRSVDDGSLWVRPKEEFEDGRFEALTAAQEAGKS